MRKGIALTNSWACLVTEPVLGVTPTDSVAVGKEAVSSVAYTRVRDERVASIAVAAAVAIVRAASAAVNGSHERRHG